MTAVTTLPPTKKTEVKSFKEDQKMFATTTNV